MDASCRTLASKSEHIVISVDYRLAPEHPFPTATEDAYAATQWVSEHAAELGGDAQQIAVAGDSAGGNLAAVVSLMTRDRSDWQGAPLIQQILIYPMLDATMSV